MLFSKLAVVPLVVAFAGNALARPALAARQVQSTSLLANFDPATALVNPDPLTAATPVPNADANTNNNANSNVAENANVAPQTQLAIGGIAAPIVNAIVSAVAPAVQAAAPAAASAAAPAATAAADKNARVKEFLTGGAGLLTKLLGLSL
ncbi:hypothetical protein PC9H_011447 [Pleurotus ostreatus]|uniref:Uncharacterized protein n=1 Tax=Pleurotus ostreatus TaxID=5322 RepID=A0A8H7DN61_PLEOS|nr:uncharacterized protein PC9H_011447 [Pleurotus ostreatus]KAF7420928.1 hypothetical protein PC9H_011447 [Pleurotus ostreatus]